eukprot:5485980-Pleurochrysis_carterae.AAC.1
MDVKTKLMLLGPLPQLLSLGEVFDAFMECFCADRLERRLFNDMYHNERPGIQLLTSPLTSIIIDSTENMINKWGIENMDMYLNTVENAVRSSFSTSKSKFHLSRFDALRDKVAGVVRFMMSSRADTFLHKLERFTWDAVYMAPLFRDGNAWADKVKLSVHAIVFKEL